MGDRIMVRAALWKRLYVKCCATHRTARQRPRERRRLVRAADARAEEDALMRQEEDPRSTWRPRYSLSPRASALDVLCAFRAFTEYDWRGSRVDVDRGRVLVTAAAEVDAAFASVAVCDAVNALIAQLDAHDLACARGELAAEAAAADSDSDVAMDDGAISASTLETVSDGDAAAHEVDEARGNGLPPSLCAKLRALHVDPYRRARALWIVWSRVDAMHKASAEDVAADLTMLRYGMKWQIAEVSGLLRLPSHFSLRCEFKESAVRQFWYHGDLAEAESFAVAVAGIRIGTELAA